MKLEKIITEISFPGSVSQVPVKKKIKVEGVVEWGLVIHRQATKDSRLLSKDKWIVTHLKSGRRILYDIQTKEQAIRYMVRLHDEVCHDWRFTPEELKSSENSMTMQEYVRMLQGEINDNNKIRI